MSSLKSAIEILAETFASSVLAAIRSASLEEVLAGGGRAVPKRGPGRPPKSASAPASSVPAKRGLGRPPKSAGTPAVPAAAKRGPGRPPKSAAPTSAAPKKAKGGRLARRSPEDLEKIVTLVVAKLKESKGGLRSEQLQAALKLGKKELVGPLGLALAAKKITKKGQKRSTTYFAS